MPRELELVNVIGFEGMDCVCLVDGSSYAKSRNKCAVGKVHGGLHYHPDGKHLVYPLGSNIAVRMLKDGSTSFLQGHDGPITCIAVSSSGRYIASGNSTHMGFKVSFMSFSLYAKSNSIYQATLHVCEWLYRPISSFGILRPKRSCTV